MESDKRKNFDSTILRSLSTARSNFHDTKYFNFKIYYYYKEEDMALFHVLKW